MNHNLIADEEALKLMDEMKKENGNIIFHISCGCCDGTAPLCLSEEDFKIGYNDILIGVLNDVKFYMHKENYDNLFNNFSIMIKAVNGNGSEFSLEYGSGKKFVLESKKL